MHLFKRGQAILEYLLVVVMISVTIAAIIRNSSEQIYLFWTGLANQIARPCADCVGDDPPEL